ncbi:DUF262 domain-containing protein [Burkholderia ubonensis]|uniref:DUF262 domain-containing protein n=1 Tax=Burkholderia ubonensis TaxID=101571 RepID=UPI0009B5159F|nr:DUF262 domain-containing protein [Burkholderia ubonensis]
MELNAETRSVNEIFSPNKKYIVPRFQREYSWQAEEVEEFWDDVVQQIKLFPGKKIRNEEYFIGCIVLVGEDSRPEYLIVDGQQRLTTLTILLRVIVDRLSELGESTAAAALYKNVIEGTDNDGKQYFKLINESPKPFFQNELQALSPSRLKKAETEEEVLLLAAFTTLKKRLKEFSIKGLTQVEAARALRDQVLNYLKFILVTAKSEDDAYTIFETLNARGLSLTSVDLIKNWVFKNYNQIHPNDDAKYVWGEIRKSITKFSDLETFFRHYWNSKYAFASDDRLYKSFKDFLKKGVISDAKEFLLQLRGASELYRKIGAPSDLDWKVQKERIIKKSFDLLNQYRVTQVRPFLLALLECRNKKVIDQSTLINTVIKLERFHFIFSNLCQDRASGLEGKYTRAAKNLHNAGNDKLAAKEVIADLISYLQKKRPNPQRISDALNGLSFTHDNDTNKKTIQTIFSKIEISLHATQELQVGSFSLEHIEDQSSKHGWIGSIGNLIPLDEDLNNKIKQGSDFKKKKIQYGKSNFKIVGRFIEINPQDSWGKVGADKWSSEISLMLDRATEI